MNKLIRRLIFSQISESLGKSLLVEGEKAESKAKRKTERLCLAFVFEQSLCEGSKHHRLQNK